MTIHLSRSFLGIAAASLVSCALLLSSVACAKPASPHTYSGGGDERAAATTSAPAAAMKAGGPPGEASASAEKATQSLPFGAAASATVERKLIREADISLVDLQDATEAMAQVEAIAAGVGGFVGGSDFKKRSDGGHDATISLRVPSDRFGEAVRRVREVGKVGSISVKVQDVTEEYVDLDARIRNSEREERELLKLYDRQGNLSDIITIEQKLSAVREQIEQLKGRMRVLEGQVSLSTIRIALFEKGSVLPPAEDEYSALYHLKRAWRELVVLLRGLLTGLIYIVVVGWVFWVPLGILIWATAKQQRRKPPRKPRATHGTPPPPPV